MVPEAMARPVKTPLGKHQRFQLAFLFFRNERQRTDLKSAV